jgi:hypothetical protein
LSNSDTSLSLRRHDPDQVQRVTAFSWPKNRPKDAVSQLLVGAPLGTAYDLVLSGGVSTRYPGRDCPNLDFRAAFAAVMAEARAAFWCCARRCPLRANTGRPHNDANDPNKTSALDRRRPDRSRLRLHQALLQPSKSSAANSRMNSNLMGKSAWAATSQVSHTRRLRDP